MNYQKLLEKLELYKQKYDVKSIGKTEFGRDIFVVEKTNDKDFYSAILVASVHARENITTDLLCEFLDNNLFDKITEFNISLVLMLNPDGVELEINGLGSVPLEKQEYLKIINGNSSDFLLWKANGKGVDLNNNFDARFGTNIGQIKPCSSGFAGTHYESENETKALVSYTKSKKIFFTISYHSKGEEIYYNFFQTENLERDKTIAEKFADSTGYLIKNPEQTSSGGYKDFCVSKLHIPAITIEVGNDNLVHPIKTESLNEIFEQNKNIVSDLNFAFETFKLFAKK